VRLSSRILKPELQPQLKTRTVSVAGIRLDSREFARPFKGIICADISEIAVGTLITERPPHRSVRAQFGHTAPTLGVKRQTVFRYGFAVCAPARGTRLPGSESAPCFAGSHSPCPPPSAPPVPLGSVPLA